MQVLHPHNRTAHHQRRCPQVRQRDHGKGGRPQVLLPKGPRRPEEAQGEKGGVGGRGRRGRTPGRRGGATNSERNRLFF